MPVVPGAQVVYTLQQQAKVEPGFTQLVWQKLEEQNPEFFQAYYTRLKLKDQIVLFNHLLEQQVAMFQKMSRQYMAPPGAAASAVAPVRTLHLLCSFFLVSALNTGWRGWREGRRGWTPFTAEDFVRSTNGCMGGWDAQLACCWVRSEKLQCFGRAQA